MNLYQTNGIVKLVPDICNMLSPIHLSSNGSLGLLVMFIFC